jgi:DNA invertase Pin-like site-specific DNA recombinase
MKARGLVSEVRRVVNVRDSFTRMNQEREREAEARRIEQQQRSKAIRERQEKIAAAKKDLFLFGALGQFERDLIKERTRADLIAAAARGRKGGRKPVVSTDKLERARGMIAKGLRVREAATRLKVGKTALYEALRLGAGENVMSTTRLGPRCDT